ncbi:MAG TPA: hypothetical protein VJ385_06145 [Fibrobacteria bacterium]|nr:hypothetical protein [Fibrobacteria bacterium]
MKEELSIVSGIVACINGAVYASLTRKMAWTAMVALMALAGRDARAAGCLENKVFYQDLPPVIGKEGLVGKYPFALNCDTVFVRKGSTTTVYPGTMLYFANPTLNSVIKVEGTLIIRGTKNSYVILSGSIDSSRNGIEPGKKRWGGIEVAEGGRLDIEVAGFMSAPTPITAFSSQVRLVYTWFKGSSGMILPDGSLMAMETGWHAISYLDLTKGNAERISDQTAAAPVQREKQKDTATFWTWKKFAGGAAALVVVGVGAVILLSP